MNAAQRSSPQIEPASVALLSDPLDFFFAEHFRQRKLCNLIEEMALAETLDWTLTAEVLDFLRHDAAMHVRDEEEDLFPLMQERCPPEDEIDRVLSALTAEHAGDRHLADILIEGLEKALAEAQPPSAFPGLREAMIDFARNERRHLALENSVLLPLARRRLSEEDLVRLSARLLRRRQEDAQGGAEKEKT
ncbi:hemerythrin domain-containing protein [Pelagibius sp. CAU 1746]|uniref:hemerythrin domain-containing protein n=1 Tax=Pelagibius sp. CAU 1746 TaxID=3140370 RepID=UPI00325C3394